MNLEDKKFLAEWMGWYVGLEFGEGKIGPGLGRYWFYRGNPVDYKEMIDSRKYNPDTNVLQFIEVWENMTEIQKDDLILELNWPETSKERSTFAQGSVFGVKMLKKENLPKSMEALLEVIKLK